MKINRKGKILIFNFPQIYQADFLIILQFFY